MVRLVLVLICVSSLAGVGFYLWNLSIQPGEPLSLESVGIVRASCSIPRGTVIPRSALRLDVGKSTASGSALHYVEEAVGMVAARDIAGGAYLSEVDLLPPGSPTDGEKLSRFVKPMIRMSAGAGGDSSEY